MKAHHVKHIFIGVLAGSLLIALIIILAMKQKVQATPLTGADTDVSYFAFYDFSYAVDTIDANDADATDDGGNGGSDIKWGFSGADKMYIGSTAKFQAIYVNVGSAGYGANGGAMAITAAYWNGSTWASLSMTNNPFGSTGIGSSTFTPPEDWATTTVNGSDSLYFIYVGAGTQGTSLSQLSLLSVGGGAPTPEFSTYVYLMTLATGLYFAYKTTKNPLNAI